MIQSLYIEPYEHRVDVCNIADIYSGLMQSDKLAFWLMTLILWFAYAEGSCRSGWCTHVHASLRDAWRDEHRSHPFQVFGEDRSKAEQQRTHKSSYQSSGEPQAVNRQPCHLGIRVDGTPKPIVQPFRSLNRSYLVTAAGVHLLDKYSIVCE